MEARNLSEKALGAAARYLQARGWELLDKAWECEEGRADVVAEDGDELVFASVAVRTDIKSGFPAEAVSPERFARMERVAACWLRDHDHPETRVRFDEVSLLVVSETHALMRHRLNAFSL